MLPGSTVQALTTRVFLTLKYGLGPETQCPWQHTRSKGWGVLYASVIHSGERAKGEVGREKSP